MVSSNSVMQGTFVVMVQQTTIGIWIWANPLAGFPPAADATFYQFITFAAGVEQPVGASVTCQVIDQDGDALQNNGPFRPTGTVLLTAIAETVKWAAYVGVARRFSFHLSALVSKHGRKQ